MKPEHIHADFDEDLEERLTRLIRTAMKERRAEGVMVDGYQEFPKKLIGWVIAGAVALGFSGIAGAIVMYGKLSAVEAQLQDVRRDIDYVKRLVEPRYRGAPDEPGTH